MTKLNLQKQKSLEVDDYLDCFESDDGKLDYLNLKLTNKAETLETPTPNVLLRQKEDVNSGFGMKRAPTMVIKSVQVGRPLKTLSLITNAAIIIFFFLSISGSNWFLTSNFRVGLWEECFQDINISTTIACNRNPCFRNYVHAFVICCVLGLILAVVSTVLMVIGMKSLNVKRKLTYYNIVIGLHAAEVVLFLISLIGYPISFLNDSHIRQSHLHGDYWGVGWSYVMGWLGVIAILISTGLLHFDKDSEEIIYYEKISRSYCSSC